MGYQLPNGSTVQISKTFGDAVNITGATNATETVLTLASVPAGLAVGDVVLITGTWLGLHNLACKVKTIVDEAVTLRAVDTTDTESYTPGSMVGTLQKVSAFIDYPYITDVAKAGGDQQFATFQPLQADKQIQLNTYKNPVSHTFTFTHDSADEIRPVLTEADKDQSIQVVRIFNKRAKEERFYSAQVSFDPIPSMAPNNVEVVISVLNLQSDMMFYKTS